MSDDGDMHHGDDDEDDADMLATQDDHDDIISDSNEALVCGNAGPRRCRVACSACRLARVCPCSPLPFFLMQTQGPAMHVLQRQLEEQEEDAEIERLKAQYLNREKDDLGTPLAFALAKPLSRAHL